MCWPYDGVFPTLTLQDGRWRTIVKYYWFQVPNVLSSVAFYHIHLINEPQSLVLGFSLGKGRVHKALCFDGSTFFQSNPFRRHVTAAALEADLIFRINDSALLSCKVVHLRGNPMSGHKPLYGYQSHFRCIRLIESTPKNSTDWTRSWRDVMIHTK